MQGLKREASLLPVEPGSIRSSGREKLAIKPMRAPGRHPSVTLQAMAVLAAVLSKRHLAVPLLAAAASKLAGLVLASLPGHGGAAGDSH